MNTPRNELMECTTPRSRSRRRTAAVVVVATAMTCMLSVSFPMTTEAFSLGKNAVSFASNEGRFAHSASFTRSRSPQTATRRPEAGVGTALFSSTVSPGRARGLVENKPSVQSSVVSHLAECALKLRLKSHKDVTAIVSSNVSADLFGGSLSVGPVTVKGKGWRSELGLTCRSIEATVRTCKLDLGRFLRDQKLRLTVPARGDAMVALNADDFGSFITHPLLQPMRIGGEPFEFHRDGAIIDSEKSQTWFRGTYGGREWQCKLCRKRSGGGAVVEVMPEGGDEETAQVMSAELTRYFNNVVLELDGIYLSFLDMMVVSRKAGSFLLLSLNIEVHKFPSPGVAF